MNGPALRMLHRSIAATPEARRSRYAQMLFAELSAILSGDDDEPGVKSPDLQTRRFEASDNTGLRTTVAGMIVDMGGGAGPGDLHQVPCGIDDCPFKRPVSS